VSAESFTTKKRVLVAGASISSFVLGTILFQSIFNIFNIESITSAIMSVVSGTIISWIVLILSGVLKDFTIKGVSFELSSTLKEVKEEVKTYNTEICGRINDLNQNFLNSIQNLNNRMDTVVTNISSNSAKSETNFFYAQSKEELNAKLKESETPSRIDQTKLLSREEVEKIDVLMNRVKTLEETLGRKITLTPPEMLSRANYYYYKNQFKEAIILYRDVLKEDESNYDALNSLALCYEKSGNSTLSLEYFKKANEINKTDTSFYNVGVTYLNQQDYENAKKYFDKCLEKNSKYYDAIIALGDIAGDTNNFSLAKEKYEQVLEQNPNHLGAIEKLAILYQHNNDIINAKKYAEKLTNITAKNIHEKISKGIGLVILDKLSDALEIFNELLIKDPNHTAALYNKACIMSLRNNIDESIMLLQKLLKINKNYKNSISRDPDLENIRKDSRFQDLLDS
jgi:tetratricopeptide (TPR) repeat protein